METCSVGHHINSSGKCRCDDIAKLAVCYTCGDEAILAPEGWDSFCLKHFPYRDYERGLMGETTYSLVELIYLEAMGVHPLYWLMNARDNLHCLPADECVVCHWPKGVSDDSYRRGFNDGEARVLAKDAGLPHCDKHNTKLNEKAECVYCVLMKVRKEIGGIMGEELRNLCDAVLPNPYTAPIGSIQESEEQRARAYGHLSETVDQPPSGSGLHPIFRKILEGLP